MAQLLVSRGAIVDAAKVQHTGQAVCILGTLDSQNLLLSGHAMFHPTRVCAVPWWHPGQRGDAPVHRIHERPRGGCGVPHRHGRCRPACPGEQKSGANCARKCFQEELDEEDEELIRENVGIEVKRRKKKLKKIASIEADYENPALKKEEEM